MPGILLMYSYMVNGKIYEGMNERTNERMKYPIILFLTKEITC